MHDVWKEMPDARHITMKCQTSEAFFLDLVSVFQEGLFILASENNNRIFSFCSELFFHQLEQKS